jgi:hypothetical protein
MQTGARLSAAVFLPVLLSILSASCSPSSSTSGSASGSMSAAERQAIVDSLTRQVKAAYDITKPNAEQRLLSLYPDSGRIVSAGAGRMVTSRDSLAMGIKAFWTNVGANMRDPKWIWDEMVFDVLSPTSAVMTATYHVPHFTPRNQPHTIAGAWTAVFQKRGARWYVIQEHLSDAPTMPDSAMAPMPAMPPTTKKPK